MKWITALLVLLGVAGVAYADSAVNPDAPQSLAALWPMLAVAVANLAGLAIPRLADEASFFHSAKGKAVLTVLGAFFSAIPSAVQAHGLCWAMLAWASLGTVGTLTSALSPRAAAAVFVPFLFFVVMAPGCKTAGGKAFAACELGHLGETGQTAFATAHDIADNPGSTVSDLEAAGFSLLPGQLECGAKALLAWLESLAAPAAPEGAPVQQALMFAHADVTHEHAKAVLRAYLAKHPATACGDRRVAQLEPVPICDTRADIDTQWCRPINMPTIGEK